ncbi:FAD-binding monooxygenase boa2 [Ciborinia camelliae]|nr:FAD-binding monooxygenase boa2 [Ciborinia camelliae]
MSVAALQADEHRFAIILGAGAAGIIQGCSFIREKVLPLEEFQILDRNGAYGGVWWRNTYPGAAAAGAFTVPKKADVPGIDAFKGEEWHSIDWPKDADLKGKTVAVIGTGPSACQFIPRIHPEVKSLIVYQRSPGHVLPRNDFVSGWFRKFLFGNFPFTMRCYRWLLMKKDEVLRKRIFNPESWLQKKVISMTKDHLHKQIKDETLRRKLESKDVFGCKRPMILDNYFPIFTKDNVELVTDSVTEITENGIISKDAETGLETERKTDVLIWGTGYNPVDFGLPVPTRGRTGQLLAEKYQPELFSLYGVAVDDFPNYFNFLGPNSSSYETSVMELFELQAHHTCLVTQFLFQKNVGSFRYAVMPKEERVRDWTLSLRPGQAKLPPANPNCRSYYRYKALIAKIDFKRDWVLLQNRIGQRDVQISEF